MASALLASMNEYHTLLASRAEHHRSRINELHTILIERGAQVTRRAWNLELPFKLKQGQIEVEEAAVVTDFGSALLVHRSEVSELEASPSTLLCLDPIRTQSQSR